jgi:hypothetical protein
MYELTNWKPTDREFVVNMILNIIFILIGLYSIIAQTALISGLLIFGLGMFLLGILITAKITP